MASIIYTPKDIFEKDFKTSVRGYKKQEVDEFLDDIIKDYDTYASLVNKLQEENAYLREELDRNPTLDARTSPSSSNNEIPQKASMTNFDILKRLNRLEKEVFSKQIVDAE